MTYIPLYTVFVKKVWHFQGANIIIHYGLASGHQLFLRLDLCNFYPMHYIVAFWKLSLVPLLLIRIWFMQLDSMSYSVTLWKLSLVPLRSVVFSGKNTSLLAAQVQSAFCHIFFSQPNNKQMSLNWVITGIHYSFSSILQHFIKVKIKVNFIWDNFSLSKPVLSYHQ